MKDPDNIRLLAKNIFVFGQCMEGTQFYGLFGMILSLYRQNKFPGIGQMAQVRKGFSIYTHRQESLKQHVHRCFLYRQEFRRQNALIVSYKRF